VTKLTIHLKLTSFWRNCKEMYRHHELCSVISPAGEGAGGGLKLDFWRGDCIN